MSTVRTSVGRFVWHDHLSEDREAATRFYSELLGWEIEVWKPGELDYPMIKVGDESHGGFGPAQGAPPHWLAHVRVEDADAAAARAEGAGGRILAPAFDIPEVGRMAVVADPQGAVLSVFTPGAGEWEPAGGVFVWDELMTSDVEAAKRFYGEVVGWEARDQDMGEAGAYTLFSSGGEDRAGALPIPPGLEAPPHWLTYLGTADADATAARAAELGGIVQREPFDVLTVGRIAVLADPTGAYVGLFQPASE